MRPGLIIRDLPLPCQQLARTESLRDYLKRATLVAIADIDTRRLTRILRDKGAQAGCIMAGEQVDAEDALAGARASRA